METLDALPLATVVVSFLLLINWLMSSFSDYLAHGPGGLGQTVEGWLTSSLFKLAIRSRGLSVHSVDVAELEAEVKRGDSRGWIDPAKFPHRAGQVEKLLSFPIPQRHIVYEENQVLALAQLSILTDLAHENPTRLRFACSLFPHTYTPLGQANEYTPCPGPAPQSAHLTLSPRDAQLVIERGWGVRHPASGNPPWPIPPLPLGLVLVFAPRDERELEVVRRLCAASVGYAAGTSKPLVV